MKKLIIICAALLLASPAWGILYVGNSDYTNPYVDDQYTAALWHFDESSVSTTAVDDATWDDTGHDLTIVTGLTDGWNSPALMELNPAETWVSSKDGFGTCANTFYNSNSDSNMGPLSTPDNPSTLYTSQGGDWTYEFWMNPDNAGGGWGSRILKKYTGGCFNIGYGGGGALQGHLSLGWYAPGGWYSVPDTYSAAIAIGQWTHVMITADQTSDTDTAVISFWYNGALGYSFTTEEGKTFSNWDVGSVKLLNDDSGVLYSARQYLGMLDEVRISNCLRIPEPTTITLLAMSALAFLRRKK